MHAGQPAEPVTGAVKVPIYQTSTYAVPDEVGEHTGFEYAQGPESDPYQALEDNVAALEGGIVPPTLSPRAWPRSPRVMTLVRGGRPACGRHRATSTGAPTGFFDPGPRSLQRLQTTWVDTTDLAMR